MNVSSYNRPCPVCGETRAEVLHSQQLVLPAEFGLPETCHLLICVTCGMAYCNIASEPANLTAYYRAETYALANWGNRAPDVASLSKLRAPFDVARLRVVVKQLSELLPRRDLRLLDVGCGSGTLLSLLSDAGFTDVQGIDPSPPAVFAANQLGQRVSVGDLDLLPADLGTFDAVIISHVLEHLGQPREVLKTLRHVLRPGGLVYAEVPDASRYAEFLTEPFADFSAGEHVNHFSMDHLKELFRTSGFGLTSSGRKESLLADNWISPAIYGTWHMLDAVPDDCAPAVLEVEGLRESLIPYVTGSRALLAQFNKVVGAKLLGRKQVAVRCLGYRAWTLLGNTILRDLDIVAYIDNDPSKQALTVQGIRVTAPEDPLPIDIPIIVLAYHVENAVVREYATSDPKREVIKPGKSKQISREALAS